MTETSQRSFTGTAAGVPYLLTPPAAQPATAPVVVGWHLQDAPRTERAFAAALPLAGLNAWRVYLGLPMSGSRLPGGSMEEFLRLGHDDAVVNIYGPVAEQALAEFQPALAELGQQFGFRDGPLGLLGGSMGAAVALSVLAGGQVPVAAAVLASPMTTLRPVVEANARHYEVEYVWSPTSEAIAAQLDFVARAGQVAAAGAAVCFAVGENDDPAILGPAAELRAALASQSARPDRVRLITVPGMAHTLADEPGTDPAPQTTHAAVVDAAAVEWFDRWLR